jgi:hypothetical protein
MLFNVFARILKELRVHLIPESKAVLCGGRAAAVLLACLSLACGSAAGVTSAADASHRVAANYGKIPLSFEPNKGQTDPSVQFLSRGSGYSLFLTRDEVVLNLERQRSASPSQTPGSQPGVAPVDTLRMKLVGASAATTITGLEPQSGVVSYLIGNDHKKWHTGIQTFGKVNFAQVYPGVDLVFYGNQRQLEYDFVVAAGADASRIGWQIDGAKPTIDADGNLVLSAANGPAGFKKPVLYQMDGDRKVAVEGAFTVAGNRIGFQLGSYDHAKPLIIDPVLTYASYLGGSFVDTIGSWPNYNGSGNSYATTAVTQGIAIDSEGSAYVTGTTQSNDFPVQNPYMNTPAKSTASYSIEDTAFVTKFSPDGSSLVYSTYLGGSDSDNGMAITVDSAGEAFVTGWTDSPDFPTTSGAYQTICGPGYTDWWAPAETTTCPGGTMSPFLFKLNAAGSGLVYSTFLGGAGNAMGEAIAVDAAGRAYLVGDSETRCQVPGYQGVLAPYSCFPTTSGAIISGTQVVSGSDYDAFIAVFDPTGANLLYSSLFGDMVLSAATCEQGETCYGLADTFGISVAVDASGNFYLAGETNGMELPTTPGVIQPTTGPERSASQQNIVAGIRGFIAKFNPVTTAGGSSLAYATYLGGSTVEPGDSNGGSTDSVNSIITDANGNAYVYGATDSPDFPVTSGAYQTSCAIGVVNCQRSAFVAKLNPTGTALVWSTYLGSRSGNLDGVSLTGPIQLDGNGNVYVTGKAEAGNFPWVGNMEPYTGAPVFVSELDPTGSKLLFSTMFGAGNDSMMPAGLAVDPAGNMYVAMNDETAGTIVTPGSFQQTFGGWTDGFVAKISAIGTATVALAAAPSPVAAGQSVTLTATVTPTATYASVPTGTIEFQDGGNALGTAVTLDATGKATYTSSTLLPETHSLTAVYSGDSTYPTGNGAQTLVVNGLTATVTVTPSKASITTAASLSVTIAVTGSGGTPSGTVTLSGGGYNSPIASLSSGSAIITIPANSLTAGTDTLTASYSGDTNYNSATGSGTVTVTTPATPAITVTPASNTINTAASLSVTVTVGASGGTTPTGTVILSGGGYTSAAVTLVNGSATIVVPANSLTVGNDTLTASYSGDANYASASGSTPASSPVTVTPALIAATVTASPATLTTDTGSTLSVPVTVTGAGVTPTGTVTLSGGGYTSSAATLVNGSYTFTIPSNSLSAGADTLTATYSGDSVYLAGTGTASVTVTQSAYSLAATAPAAVTAGSAATSTVTVSTTTAYSGTVTLSCALTKSPSGAANLPTCAATTSSVTLTGASASATATVTVTSVAATTAMASPLNDGKQNGWMRVGGGTVLALLVFLGIPSRRRGWRAMLGVLLLIAALGTLSGCGGSSSSSSGKGLGKAGTTAGSYTFTVTGTGTPAETPAPTTTFTLTIN